MSAPQACAMVTRWSPERLRALRYTPQGPDLLERPTGFEPATSSLGSWHSATELRPPGASYITHRRVLRIVERRRYCDSLSDMLNAWMTSSLRAFQLTRLLTP